MEVDYLEQLVTELVTKQTVASSSIAADHYYVNYRLPWHHNQLRIECRNQRDMDNLTKLGRQDATRWLREVFGKYLQRFFLSDPPFQNNLYLTRVEELSKRDQVTISGSVLKVLLELIQWYKSYAASIANDQQVDQAVNQGISRGIALCIDHIREHYRDAKDCLADLDSLYHKYRG